MVNKRENTFTLPKFNRNRPLKVFCQQEDVFIVDYDSGRVWRNYELEPISYSNWRHAPEYKLSSPPKHYVQEIVKNNGIGGVGVTMRYAGLFRAHVDARRKGGCTVVYATNILDKQEFINSMQLVERYINLGDFDEQEDEYGISVDIYVSLDQLDMVCAQIARTGAKMIMDNLKANAFECIGTERLDRRSEVPHRTSENWRYSYIPEHWNTPLTWEDLAINFMQEPLERIPQPLQQHVVQLKLKSCKDKHERRKLQTMIPRRRWVSGALDLEQTRQLLDAFYIYYVEQTRDVVQRKVAACIMYRYLVCRGFSSRWMGKYNQTACFLGNGKGIRKFKRLEQYAPHRLPIHVLNSIYQPGGKLKGHGKKKSRSRYASEEDRYEPKRKMRKPNDWMDKMRALPELDANEEFEKSCPQVAHSDDDDDFD
jgi:hypothetical protein